MSAWTLLGTLDERLFHAVVARRRPPLDIFMRTVTHLADPVVAIAAAATLALGVVPAPAGAGVSAAATMTVSHLFVEIIKRTIVRPRPRLPVGIRSLVDPPDRFSFPSGHAAAALALLLPLALAVALPVALALLAVALLVGVSRCYLGVHYPGDVIAGWGLATLATFLVMLISAGPVKGL